MPLTKTGKKVMAAMVKEYGAKKGKEVFYAMAHSKGKKWHHSPDSYNDSALGETPPRTEFHGKQDGLMEPGSGGNRVPGMVQQTDGTENLRADAMTKSSGRAQVKGGTTRYPAIDRFSGENV